MKFKKIAAAAAASAMVISAMGVTASAAEYEAFLMFTDYDWLWGNWNAGAAGDVTVDGYGTYTVSLDNTQAENAMSATNGAQVFCVDIIGAGSEFTPDNTIVTIDSIKTDGTEIKVDNSKINYGDIEENGNFRIEIRNAYGVTGDMNDPHYEPIDSENFSAAEKIEVTFTLASADGSAPAAEETVEEVTEAAPETTEAAVSTPDSDSATTSTKTGNTSAAALAGVMAVAAAAAFAVKKSK
ncbi:MAG: hypothetical protein K2K57_01085 [Oscillospiraceae bacterium]|nr:hypothetical protein [Oscillospiraceae bacterium]